MHFRGNCEGELSTFAHTDMMHAMKATEVAL